MSTRSWCPVRWSDACNAASSESRVDGLMNPAESVTQRVGAGGAAKLAAAGFAHANNNAAPSKNPKARPKASVTPLERDLWRSLSAWLRLEVRLFGEARTEEVREDHGGKRLTRGVERLRGIVVAHALNGDPVFRAFELRLQVEEILIRLQIRIAFDDNQQSRKRGAKSVLRLLELRERLRVVWDGLRTAGRDLPHFRTCFRDGDVRA